MALMKAEEARKKCEDKSRQQYGFLLGEVEATIDQAVRRGETCVSVNVEVEHQIEIVKWLRNLGYETRILVDNDLIITW